MTDSPPAATGPLPAGLTPVRPGFEIDTIRLDKYLAQALPEYRGPLTVLQFEGGQSNPTYLLDTPGHRYVLRRKPPGRLLPSAHAVDREYRVISALGRGAGVPVPRAWMLCEDPSVAGTPFYVMDWVAGRILRDPAMPGVERGLRRAHAESMVAALACLHRLDYRAVGLGDFGHSGGYVARQFSRWSGQYLADAAAGRVAAMDRLVDWLPTQMPARDETCIVHGDYRCDNVVFDPAGPRVAAVLDWELATLGDPLADFAYYVMIYRMPRAGLPGLLGTDLSELGLPTEEECVEQYCRLTGRESIVGLDFYVAFNLFKVAAVLHGIRGRALRGNAASGRARDYGAMVEQAAELGWQQAERAMRSTAG